MSWDGEGRRPYRDKKREKIRLRRLTLALLQLKSLNFMEGRVDEELYQKCCEAIAIKEHFVARRRAERRIVELLRQCNEETVLFLESSLSQSDTLAAHREERVLKQRELLLNGGKQSLSAFVSAHADVNIQRLRQLIRNSLKEGEAKEKSTKALESMIREIFLAEDAQ